MTLKERLSRDRETLKTLDRRAQSQFIWDYYKLPLIAVASCLFLAVLALCFQAGRGNVVMYAVFVNTDVTLEERDDAPLRAVLADSGMDMAGKRIDVNTNLYLGHGQNEIADGQTVQVLAALFGISDLDLFAADEPVFRRYAEKDAFANLSVLIEPELLSRHEEDLYWYEDASGNRVLGGIVLHPGSVLHTAGYYHADVVVGAAANGEYLDAAVRFIRELL